MKEWRSYTILLGYVTLYLWYNQDRSDCTPWHVPLIALVVWTVLDLAKFAIKKAMER